MGKAAKSRKSSAKKTRNEWPLVVYVWIVSLGIVSYLGARIILDAYSHPVHWISGVVGGIIGCLIGWLWYRWRGDMI